MPLEKISQVSGQAVYVPGDDIDTDRIIPARFMKCVTFDGLGEYLFYDMKFKEDGSKKEHPLNDPRFINASIMLSGSNFGCGSSREHAPQSLYRAGFRAVIAGNFAEIFFGNSINLGMPCISLSDSIGLPFIVFSRGVTGAGMSMFPSLLLPPRIRRTMNSVIGLPPSFRSFKRNGRGVFELKSDQT